jgi:hypothetical protein
MTSSVRSTRGVIVMEGQQIVLRQVSVSERGVAHYPQDAAVSRQKNALPPQSDTLGTESQGRLGSQRIEGLNQPRGARHPEQDRFKEVLYCDQHFNNYQSTVDDAALHLPAACRRNVGMHGSERGSHTPCGTQDKAWMLDQYFIW